MGSGLSKHEDEVRAENHRREEWQRTDAESPAEDAAKETDAEASGCPMKKKDGSYGYDWWRALTCPSFPHGPGGKKPLSEQEAREKTMAKSANEPPSSPEGCPVKHQEYNVYSQPIDPLNNMPKHANQVPAPGQSEPLSTERVKSTIPKGGAEGGSTWTYPSPQMFYNALARKGKLEDTDEADIDSVVALHNNMNEKTWRKVLEWEETVAGGSAAPKLLKFQGRPTDLSPKAAFKHYVLGHPLPFDRHDWTVLREDGTTVRYIIDYYHDESSASDDESTAMPGLADFDATPSLLVDVRPALDGPREAWNRVFTMPYARHVKNSTDFEPLPMQPSANMKSQLTESVKVWESIQAAAASKGKPSSEDEDGSEISEKEAKQLAQSFAQMLRQCRDAQERINKCDSEEECAKASVDLTICMSKIVCPVQYEALAKSIADESSPHAQERIEAALSSVNDCVVMKTGLQVAAKRKYPHLFR